MRKLTAPKWVEGSRLPIVKRHTKTANQYDISPMPKFDLALFFGLTGSSEGFDPPPVDSSTPNPPPPDPVPPAGSPAGVNSVNRFPPPLHALTEISHVRPKDSACEALMSDVCRVEQTDLARRTLPSSPWSSQNFLCRATSSETSGTSTYE